MLWGGRFKEGLDPAALKFSSSFNVDKDLFYEDIRVSLVHADMLFRQGYLDQDECSRITSGLKLIEAQWSSGQWKPKDEEYEDVHSAIEARLTEIIGAAAGKLHTGRSRNDQVATGMRLWVKKACTKLKSDIRGLQFALLGIAENHTESIIPGYTHVQRAQPVSIAFHILAYVEMLGRDLARTEFVFSQSDLCPLGSGALAGSTLLLDREYTAKGLGFSAPSSNALDAVSDRDFMLDFLNLCTLGMMHLSRLAEELVYWSSSEWNFVRLSDQYTTGSSLMPQKKNPDMAELIRGKSGRVYGNYIALATTMKGLPMSYNRDMQEDKEGVFDSFSTYSDSLAIMERMISTMKINTSRFYRDMEGDFSLATDLADWLVKKGIPFRESHHLVGKVVQYAEEHQLRCNEVSLDDLKKVNPVFDETALDCLRLEGALYRKQTLGSPNPDMVRSQIAAWKQKISENE